MCGNASPEGARYVEAQGFNPGGNVSGNVRAVSTAQMANVAYLQHAPPTCLSPRVETLGFGNIVLTARSLPDNNI